MTFGSLPHTGRDQASGPFHSEVTTVEETLVSKQSWEGVRLQVAVTPPASELLGPVLF